LGSRKWSSIRLGSSITWRQMECLFEDLGSVKEE